MKLSRGEDQPFILNRFEIKIFTTPLIQHESLLAKIQRAVVAAMNNNIQLPRIIAIFLNNDFNQICWNYQSAYAAMKWMVKEIFNLIDK